MDTLDKLSILAEGAKYDVSCVSSGSSRKNTPGGLGSGYAAGFCHSFTTDGRCISLLKVLMSNDCVYDCAYCVNRVSNDFPRATFTPGELVDITINFYRRNYIEGLFLSSAVYKNPNYTMELFIRVLKMLREEYRFNGYIHVKAIPGADNALVEQAGLYADRMSVNIELPSNDSLKLLAPQKNKEKILGPMGFISTKISENKEDIVKYKKKQYFVPAGQSTQVIVGATPHRDINILKLSEALYKRYKLKRVFYSAYIPVSNHPALPAIEKPPLLREHRLYQADWLLRFYGFSADELLSDSRPDLDEQLDPKCDWALRNLHLFPVEVNRCDYETLLRVPGIGVISAKRILTARRVSSLDFDDLRKLGVVLKRAQYFITCKGKYYKGIIMDDAFIRQNLVRENMMQAMKSGNMAEEYRQVSFFSNGYDYGYDYGYGYGYGHGRGHGLAGAGDFGFRGLNIQDRDFRKSLAGIGMNTGMSMNMGMGLVQGPGMDIALNIGGMNGVNMGMITAEEKMKSITGEL
ncbi:MAG: putative DNA modification/repair radical SAM protein [Clostridiaceae bacterium]|nr:putative DNA modification/repair radical SAM protein [Clostridiaceae bacterium]